MTLKPPLQDARDDAGCLRRLVASAMETDPQLEAVRIDRDRSALAVARIGRLSSERDPGELSERIQFLQESGVAGHCGLVEGTDNCEACPVGTSERGSVPLELRREGSSVTLARVTCPTAPSFWRWREVALPRWVPREVKFSGDEDYDREWRQQLGAAVLCGVLAIGAWLAGTEAVSRPLYLAAYLAGSWFTVREIRERLRAGILDIHFLMLAVAIGSATIGAWGEGAALLFLFSFSGALEHYALGRTQREIRSLFRIAPKVATRIDEQGNEQTTAVDALRAGMVLRIRPGELFSVDAEVRRGETESDESTLTGESIPVAKGVGDTVLAGTLNLWGSVEVQVLRPASESALQKVIRLIQDAQHLKAPSQRFTDRFSTGYTYIVLGLSLGMFLVWWLGAGWPPFVSTSEQASAFYRAMTLLVVASPCALVLSIPSAVLAAIAWAARRGILFRGGAAVERLAQIQVVALDKTGTLTTGDLEVERAESFPPGREHEVAQLACSLERWSSHPLARAISRYGKKQGIPLLEVSQFESLSGLGVRGRVKEVQAWLGRREWIERETGPLIEAGAVAEMPGRSEIWVRSDAVVGRMLLRDDVRPEACRVISQLEADGLEVLVLTGDRPDAAEALRTLAGVRDIRAGLRPEDKVEVIRQLGRSGRTVAMIGDGVNDAPSLAAADVGVAMGARGADAALEQAEVVLMHDRLENFLTAVRLSQRARRVIRQNLAVSLGTVVVLVSLALVGGIPLTVGVVGHEGSTVVVVLNSLRLLLSGAGKRPAPTPTGGS